MKLIEYIPSYLQNIREYKEIFKVEEIEIDKLKKNIEKILEEVIVNTSDNYGLTKYEKIYNIKDTTNDLQTRRYNILSKINNKIPYTYNWLINKLNNTIGKDNYIVSIDCNSYKISIEVFSLFKDIAVLLKKDLREQLPANLVVAVNLFQEEQSKSYFAGIVHIGDNIIIRQVI